MIIQEIVVINHKYFKHTYSDANYYIQKVGTEEEYKDAFDLLSMEFTYIETNKPIPEEENNLEEIEESGK